MREQLAALNAAQVRAASASVWERLAVLPAFAEAQRVLVYVSTGREVETQGLIQQLLALGRRVCVPQFDEPRQRYLASELRDFAADLAPGRFGILEPRAAAVRPVPVEQLSAVLVPGLAFTRVGARLGRGLGYFDRILSGATGRRVGLAYAFQVVETLPTQAHDMAVDYVVTETEAITCRRSQP
jgi:5-formyltetrahydrofolate cyclo-ligase